MALWGTVDTLAAAPKWETTTVTFDSTSTSVVVAASDTLVLSEHGLATGDAVTYSDGGGTAVAGLTDATVYYVNHVDANTIKLYDTMTNAVAGGNTGRLDITGVGVGTAHSVQRTPSDIYFVDTTEAGIAANRAKGLQTPGWVEYNTKTVPATVVTFDATQASVVDITTDIIHLAGGSEHLFATGEEVTYADNGGTQITGLTDGDNYFVSNVGPGMIKLYSSAANAKAKGATGLVNLTAVGVGTAHTLTAAAGAVTRNVVENICPMKVAAGTAGDVGVDGTDDAVVADS